jgi:hypothetical protein
MLHIGLDAGQSHDEIPAGDTLPSPPLYSAVSRDAKLAFNLALCLIQSVS